LPFDSAGHTYCQTIAVRFATKAGVSAHVCLGSVMLPASESNKKDCVYFLPDASIMRWKYVAPKEASSTPTHRSHSIQTDVL